LDFARGNRRSLAEWAAHMPHVRGKVGIRHVEEQEIYEVDGGSYGRCVNFIGYLVTPGGLWDGKPNLACTWARLGGERTRPEENHGQCYG